MCGILGIIDHQDSQHLEERVKRLSETMVHRGPDGSGFFAERDVALGMRRLSVIDLEHGWQPLYSKDRQIVAFQNGEIYNHLDLRRALKREGYRFATQSDTETLAHGFHRWGIEGLLKRLDGMYAIAILDRRQKVLHLARDRFGEKPLFYAAAPGRFAFSSYLTTLAAFDWVDLTIDGRALDQYLATHFVAGERTIFQGIRKVLPGERLVIPLAEPTPTAARYYQLKLDGHPAPSDASLKQCLEEAVVSRLIADVPVGVFLSGGLDSAVVAAIAAKHVPHIDTFSMGFPDADYDESPHAARVAEAVGSRHHHFLFDEGCFMDLLPRVASALDEPLGDQALLPVYWLSREARKQVTVVLSGEGADEVFGGYGYYREFAPQPITWLQRLLGKDGPQAAAAGHQRYVHNPSPQTPSGFPLLADPADRERLTGQAFSDPTPWETALIDRLNTAQNPLQRATAADILTWLPDDLLVKYDRMAMAHSLEGRAPFLAPTVVEAGLALPAADRMTKLPGSSKLALRRVAKHWLPVSILKRQKQGFCLPMKSWLQQWFREYGGARTYFHANQVPGLNTDAVTNLVQGDLTVGVQRERLLFALLILTEWHTHFTKYQKNLSLPLTESTATASCPPIGQN